MGSTRARSDVVAVAQHLSRLGYLVADCGVVSARVGQEIVVTPEGVHRSLLGARDLESIRLDGKHGREVKPSSDLWTHLVIYRERENLGAIIFAHPPYASSFAISGEGLDQHVLPEMVLRLGHIPLIRQEGFGTTGDSLIPHLGDAQAFILMNRGVIAIGNDPWDACSRLELVEHYARVLLLARLQGRVHEIPDAQMALLVEARFDEEGGRNQ